MTTISNNTKINDPYIVERKRQEKLDEQKRVEEHNNKKVMIDKMMLKLYYERLDRLATYNRHKQLERAQVEQGRLIDIEIK